MEGYRKMMASLLKFQGEGGLWRQLLDDPGSWGETSGTGMFAFAMVKGVNRGWLDGKSYGPAVRKAWLALVAEVDEKAQVRNVCVGTNKGAKVVGADLEKQRAYYLARERKAGDLHGQAPILWTAAALMEK
jgi:unsaturated rhamnogalacturonyl hydrolase